jgi:general secretion pathway protein A
LTPASAALLALGVIVAFVLFLLTDARQQARDGAMKRAIWVVQLVARDYELFVEEARTRLLDLSQRPEVRALEPHVCEVMAQRLGSVRGYLDAVLAQQTGEVVCSARHDRGVGGRVASMPFVRSAAPRDATFDRYAIDPMTRHGVATVIAPAIDEGGNIRALLGVTLDLSALALEVVEAGLPKGTSVIVVDGGGVVLAHSPALTNGIGEFLAPQVLKRLAARTAGTVDAVDLSGAPANLAFAPLATNVARFGDASVIVQVPESILFAQAAWSTVWPFAGMLLALLLLAWLAWAMLDSFITRPAALLTEAMRRLAAAGGPDEHVAPKLIVDGACGPLLDALNAYEPVASRVIQQEACARLLEGPRLETDREAREPGPATPAPHDAPPQNVAVNRAPTPPQPAWRETLAGRPQPARRKAPAVARREPVEAHWGLAEPAFENAPNPKFLYLSPGHEAVLRGLTYAVRQRRGCGVLVGKPGCGKTTLVRSLIQRLEADRYDVAFVLRPLHDPVDLLREVLYELGVQTDERRRSELLHLLGARFVNNLGEHRETVIILDEAQLAPARTLKELGLLLNYQSNERSLVTVVLSGSLELGERLTASGHLEGRLGVRCRIAPLDVEHTGKYVTHRLTVAGGAATIFTGDALRLIHEMTDGIPRAINDVCDNVLMLGSLNAVSQIDADTLRSMLTPSVQSNDRALAFDLPATWLAQDRTVPDLG